MNHFSSVRGVIVVVQNDPFMLTGVAAMLHKQGFECHCAQDTEAAWKAVRGLAPDLVLCDTHLGDESGLDFCRDLKADPALGDIPVMFLSGSRDPEIVSLVQQAGGDYYLSQPLDPQVLLAMVDRALWMPHLVQNRLDAMHLRQRRACREAATRDAVAPR